MVMIACLPENELIAQDKPEVIRLKLLAWEEDEEVQFSYAPEPSVRFRTRAPVKQVQIDLVHADETGNTDDPTFWMSHYTASRIKAVKSISIHRKKPGTGNDLEPVPHPVKEHSELGKGSGGKIKRFTVEVDLAPGTSFYLNLILRKKGQEERLISCDPQVENGSRT